MKKLFLTLIIISCTAPTIKPIEPIPDRLEELRENQDRLIEEAIEIADEKNTWLVSESCDSMMWSALFGSSLERYFDYGLAEDKIEEGKYHRTPAHDCYDTARSGSTWSRDMGLSLLIYLHSQGDLEAIEQHIAFGESTGWIMGEGAKSRTIYSPALISLWYQTAKKLGHDYGKIEISNVYTKGLIDFQAHLQMLDIYLNGELNGVISETMLSRIIEHSSREPDSRFFHILRSAYQGPIEPAVDICLDDTERVGSYVRCDGEQCELAERIFSCGILIKLLED